MSMWPLISIMSPLKTSHETLVVDGDDVFKQVKGDASRLIRRKFPNSIVPGVCTQDKRLNIWSMTTGKHVRAYKVESSSSSLPSVPPAVRGKEVTASPGGFRGEGRGGAGAELSKVDLDPTGMYAAACSFDKVCEH